MNSVQNSPKSAWNTPVVVDLDKSAGDVENGFDPGTDGAGGAATSMS